MPFELYFISTETTVHAELVDVSELRGAAL